MLATRDSLQLKGHSQFENEGMEKDTPLKWKPKENRTTFISDKQTLSQKLEQETKSIYNDKRVNLSRNM